MRDLGEKIKFRQEDNIGVVRLLGEFDTDDREPLIVYFDDKMKKGIRHFIVDLSETVYIPSAVWGALITILKHARENNGDVYICGIQGQPEKVFRVMSFDKVFKTFKDVYEALNSLR